MTSWNKILLHQQIKQLLSSFKQFFKLSVLLNHFQADSLVHPGRSHKMPASLQNRVILDNHFIDREVKTEGCLSTCQRPPGKLTTKLALKPMFPKSFCAVSTLRSSCVL